MAHEVTEGVELNVLQLQDGMDGVRNAHSTCGTNRFRFNQLINII